MIRLILLSLCLLTLLGAASPSQTPAQQARGPAEICIASWKWYETTDGDYWASPWLDNTLGLLDLRTIPQASQPGPKAEGYGLFVLDRAGLCAGGAVLAALPSDLDHTLHALEIKALETGLGMMEGTLTGATTRDVLWEIFTEDVDPTGQTAKKPIRGSLGRQVRLYLGGYGVVRSEAFLGRHLTNTEAVFQADYRRNKAAGMDAATLRRWTGDTMLKLYGRMSDGNADRLMPPEHRDDGFTRPQTTVSDDFDRASDESLDTTGWTEIDGNWEIIGDIASLRTTGTPQKFARFDSDLSSDDHFAQVDVVTLQGAAFTAGGPVVRFDASATGAADMEGYLLHIRVNGGSEGFEIRKKLSSGPGITLVAGETQTASPPDTLKLEVNDSNFTAYLNGVSELVGSDTDITGHVRTGMAGFIGTGGGGAAGDAEYDNFTACDSDGSGSCTAPPAERRIIFIG